MILTSELAQQIIEQISQVVGYNINIMNNTGIIVASNDSERINSIHQGAVDVMKIKSERVIYPTEDGNILGTKPGVNVPIFFQQQCIGTVGITGNPDEVYKLAQIVKITVEALVQQSYLSQRLGYQRKALEEWVDDLINPEFTNYSLLEERAQFLKIDTQQECSIFLLDTGDLEEIVAVKQDRILQLIQNHFDPLFVTFTSKFQLVTAFPITTDHNQIATVLYNTLSTECRHLCIGMGASAKSVQGYRTSYLGALHSIQLMKKLQSRKQVMHINDWGMIKILDTVPKKIRERYLRDFPSLLNNELDLELQSTLETFLNANLSVEDTASQLHIHRNTVTYRLDKIKKICGLNPRQFDDAFQLKILLFFKKIHLYETS